MKKLILLCLIAFITLSAVGQEKPKKSVKEAIEVAKLTKKEVAKVKKLMAARRLDLKAVKDKGLDMKVQRKELKAVRELYETKIVSAIGKEKGDVYNDYWKVKKKKG